MTSTIIVTRMEKNIPCVEFFHVSVSIPEIYLFIYFYLYTTCRNDIILYISNTLSTKYYCEINLDVLMGHKKQLLNNLYDCIYLNRCMYIHSMYRILQKCWSKLLKDSADHRYMSVIWLDACCKNGCC